MGLVTDPTDAGLALDILSNHASHFKPLNPQSMGMRTLRDPRRDKMMPKFTELEVGQYLVGNIEMGKVYILLPFRVV